MKKLLIALLSLSVAGAAFAADPALKVSGYVGAGAVIGYGTDIGGVGKDSSFQSYSDDWDGNGTWGTVTAEYAGKESGFVVTLAADSATQSGSLLDTAYGWAIPMDSVKLFAGVGYAGMFDGVDDDSNDYFKSEGLSVTYNVSGLTVGAGMVLAPAAATENASWVMGAAYGVDKLFDVRFSALTNESDLDKMAVSAKYTGIENLTISGGYLAVDIAEVGSAVMDNWIDYTAKYQVNDKLYAQVVVYAYLEKEYYDIAPRVGYQVSDKLSVYGQLSYETEGKKVAGTPTNEATMQPRAYMEFAFDDVSKFYAQYEYDTDAETSGILLQYVFSF